MYCESLGSSEAESILSPALPSVLPYLAPAEELNTILKYLSPVRGPESIAPYLALFLLVPAAHCAELSKICILVPDAIMTTPRTKLEVAAALMLSLSERSGNPRASFVATA